MKANKMKNRTFKIDDVLWQEIEKMKSKTRMNKSVIIRIAIIQYLNKLQKSFELEYDKDLKNYLEEE